MNLFKCFFVFFVFFSCTCFCENKDDNRYFYILHCRDAGMFSILDDVLSLTYAHEHQKIHGAEIDFKDQGYYYDKNHGLNWWLYYFDPCSFGNDKKKKKDSKGIFQFFKNNYDRKEANFLISKYIKIKPFVIEKTDYFINSNFSGFYVIGIHFRGTDKISEAPRVKFERIKFEIDKQLKGNKDKNCKIFIATDEQKFIDYMSDIYGNKICYNKEAMRSTDGTPLHMSHYNRYQAGLDALMDSLILSRTQVLLRTESNLSRWSTYWNPDLPVYLIH